MGSSHESSPLLAHRNPCTSDDTHDLHAAVFTSLDASHHHDHVHDHAPSPDIRRVKAHLISATSPPGHGHPLHHHLQSPALLLRLRQSFDHGFHEVWAAVRHGVKSIPKHLPTSSSSTISISSAPSSPRTAMRAVFVLAVLTMLAMTSVSPTLLLFMNVSGYTTPVHITPYVTASALSTASPVVSNLLITALASHIGPGRALMFGALVATIGLVVMALARGSLFIFLAAYAVYASSNSLRVVRVALLSKVVSPETRTSVLATHALMTPIGALIGPLIWIVCQTYRGQLTLFGWFIIDRFSMAYFIAALAFLIIAIVAALFLTRFVTFGHEHDAEQIQSAGSSQQQIPSGSDSHSGHLHPTVLHYSDGHDQAIDLQLYRNHVFQYFCLIMLGVNLSAGFYMTAFQPILVNVFHTSDAKLGAIFELIAIFAIVPPLLVALLSKYLMDRQILIIGLVVKLLGMSLFLPLFGAVQEWQVITGFLLIIKASIFFSTAGMSLFTKLLGSMSTSTLLGLLASGSSIGPAVAQIVFSRHIVETFGSLWFGIFSVPAVITMGAILWPSRWRKLDPSGEFTELVTHEAEMQQNEEA